MQNVSIEVQLLQEPKAKSEGLRGTLQHVPGGRGVQEPPWIATGEEESR